VIASAFHARAEHVRHAVDYSGAVLLAGGLSAIVLYTSLGGTTYPWDSPAILTLIALGAALIWLLVDSHVLSPKGSRAIVHIALVIFSLVLAIGLRGHRSAGGLPASWTPIR